MKVSNIHKDCCANDEIIKTGTQINNNHTTHKHTDQEHSDDDGHNHGSEEPSGWLSHWPLLTSLAVVVVMMVLEYGFHITFNTCLSPCRF
jgi:Cd2+/Zn2+-exporting ATPase